MIDIRRPPLLDKMPGRCCWCGDPIQPRLKLDGQPAAIQGSFHKGCGSEYRAAFSPASFRDDLIERDGEKCADCGEAPAAWVPQYGTKARPDTVVHWNDSRIKIEPIFAGPYVPIIFKIILEVDHKIPLWKVADMHGLSHLERRAYFLIGNLWLLCVECHERKTTKEAAERAHTKRLEQKRVGGAIPRDRFGATIL